MLSNDANADIERLKRERIKTLDREARKLYRDGLYEGAVKALLRLHELTDDPEYLFRLGLTYQHLFDWERCVGYLQRYVEESPVTPKRDRAANARRSCEARRDSSQTLIIETEPPGADVYLGNRKTAIQGQTPFRAKRPTGVERVWLELAGYEPEIKDIEIRRDEPMRLRVILKKRVDRGWLFVASSIIDAQVFLDGKAIQLTPFERPIPIKAGWHQVQVQRDGFTGISRQVEVPPFLLAKVDADLARSASLKSWRSALGWVNIVVGFGAIAAGAAATYLADQEYNDTPEFHRLKGYESLGYVGGGVLLSSGAALLIWDHLRDSVLESDRNPNYGRPVEIPDPALLKADGGSP